jgi:hypothetical protein
MVIFVDWRRIFLWWVPKNGFGLIDDAFDLGRRSPREGAIGIMIEITSEVISDLANTLEFVFTFLQTKEEILRSLHHDSKVINSVCHKASSRRQGQQRKG